MKPINLNIIAPSATYLPNMRLPIRTYILDAPDTAESGMTNPTTKRAA